jgi:hypothetical protein
MNKDFLFFDFETLSNKPLTAPIISMGAICGNWGDSIKQLRDNGFYCNVRTEEQLELGLKPNKETLKWWLSQGPDAQKVIGAKDKITVQECLELFNSWCELSGINQNTKTWIRAPHFDMIIFENLQNKIYGSSEHYPFNHWKVRDVRTAIDLLYGVDNGYAPNARDLIADAGLIEHNALDDCIKDYLQMNQMISHML